MLQNTNSKLRKVSLLLLLDAGKYYYMYVQGGNDAKY